MQVTIMFFEKVGINPKAVIFSESVFGTQKSAFGIVFE